MNSIIPIWISLCPPSLSFVLFPFQPFSFLYCVQTCKYMCVCKCICWQTPHLTKGSCHWSIIQLFSASVTYGFTNIDTALSSERPGSSHRCTNRSRPIVVVKHRREDARVRLVPDWPGISWFVLKNIQYPPLVMHYTKVLILQLWEFPSQK